MLKIINNIMKDIMMISFLFTDIIDTKEKYIMYYQTIYHSPIGKIFLVSVKNI